MNPAVSRNRLLVLGDPAQIPRLVAIFSNMQTASARQIRFEFDISEERLEEQSLQGVDCCVLLDLGNPELAVIHLRTAVMVFPDIPVILLTATHTTSLEAIAIQAGADDCVSASGITEAAFDRIVNRSLQRADRRRALLEATPVPMIHATQKGVVRWANAALLKLLACASVDDARALTDQRMTADLVNRLANTQPPHSFELRHLVTDFLGTQHDVALIVGRWNPAAPEQGIQIVLIDITEVETQRRALDTAERAMRDLYNNTPVMMYTVTAEFKIQDVNDYWLKRMGYTRSEVIGQKSTAFYAADFDDSLRQNAWKELRAGVPTNTTELKLATRSGEFIFGVSYSTPVHNPAGELIAARISVLDVSDFKRAAAERDEMERELRLAQKLESVGQLAAGIAHEINTPAQYVSDNLAFLQSSFDDCRPLFQHVCEIDDAQVAQLLESADAEFLQGEIPKSIEQAQEGVRRIRKIVQALKEFSHPGHEERESANVNRVIENSATLSRGEWKNIAELELHLSADVPQVMCNPSGIGQVLLNMIVNAAHAIADGQQDQAGDLGKIVIRSSSDEQNMIISIADSGCGMTEQVKARIFDPFFTTKEVGRGTGQGLSIARSIVVEQHRGTIAVDSVPGHGTTFTIKLPLNEKSEPKRLAALAS